VLAGTAAGLLLLAASLTGFGGLAGVLVPLWAALFTVGLVLPNPPALALSRHGEAAGTAAALLGAIQFGTGAVVSPLVGVVGNDATAMGAVVATAMALSLAVLVLVVRPWRLADLDVPPSCPRPLASAAPEAWRLWVSDTPTHEPQESMQDGSILGDLNNVPEGLALTAVLVG
jgi:DHA1 family bicyclomycin/chloramphenicol resistance-like MFS transporter